MRSFEDIAFTSQRKSTALIIEAFRGQDIVVWYGRIESQLRDLIKKFEEERNTQDEDRVRIFLQTWVSNPIDGSINRATLDTLEAAAAQSAAGEWKSTVYFRSLRDQLRRLVASEEELPRLPSINPPNKASSPAMKQMTKDVESPGGNFAGGNTPPGTMATPQPATK